MKHSIRKIITFVNQSWEDVNNSIPKKLQLNHFQGNIPPALGQTMHPVLSEFFAPGNKLDHNISSFLWSPSQTEVQIFQRRKTSQAYTKILKFSLSKKAIQRFKSEWNMGDASQISDLEFAES